MKLIVEVHCDQQRRIVSDEPYVIETINVFI